jgi:hypothetical protein
MDIAFFRNSQRCFAIVSGLYECFQYRSSLLSFSEFVLRNLSGCRCSIMDQTRCFWLLCFRKSNEGVTPPSSQTWYRLPICCLSPQEGKVYSSLVDLSDVDPKTQPSEKSETGRFSIQHGSSLAVCLCRIKEWAAFRDSLGNASTTIRRLNHALKGRST